MKNYEKFVPYSKKVMLGQSNIHGLGIITKRDIKKGETVFIIKGELKAWEVTSKKTALYGEHWIGVGKNSWIDPIGWGRYINHSSNPNCGITGKVLIRAMRNIRKGDEITIDYSTTEEQELWHLEDAMTGMKVRSIQFLPHGKFKEYFPHIPKYFQKVYHRHHKTKGSHG